MKNAQETLFTPRLILLLVLSLMAGACQGELEQEFELPRPGPTSLYVRAQDVTFHMIALTKEGGIRSEQYDVGLDEDGFHPRRGDILIDKIERFDTSRDCSGMRSPQLSFSPRWTAPEAPDPDESFWLPTRFGLPPGTQVEDALSARAIRVWGTIPPGSPDLPCEPLLAQYIELATPDA